MRSGFDAQYRRRVECSLIDVLNTNRYDELSDRGGVHIHVQVENLIQVLASRIMVRGVLELTHHQR